MGIAVLADDIGVPLANAVCRRIGQRNYDHWFAQVRFDWADEQRRTVRLTTPNRFAADWIRDRFAHVVDAAADEMLGGDTRVLIECEPTPTETVRPAALTRRAAPARPARETRKADPRAKRIRHDLVEFVVGPSNQLAYNAAVQLAEADAAFNPLFIHGGCGLGKTHLLQGLCKRFTENHAGCRWRYTTAEQFTNSYVHAVREHRLAEFRARLRRLDLLVVDDVHFLSSKSATQAEFLHTFDQIDASGAKLVLASDNHPKLIQQFSQALVSRFVSGMVVRIDTPDHAMRVRLVRALAERRGMDLNDAAVESVADRCRGSVREIEGALTTLAAMANLETDAGDRTQIGMALAHRLGAERAAHRSVQPIRFEQIVDEVLAALNVTPAQFSGKGRQKQVVLARGMAAYLGRQLTSLSFPDIARAMGRTSHSTIIAAAQRIAQQIARGDAVQLPPDGRTTPIDRFVELLRQRVCESAGACV